MDNAKIEEFFGAAVKAKLAKSQALGTKATWSMEDQLGVATEVIYALSDEYVGNEGDKVFLLEAIKKTYNHSAYAQKLEKAFAATGHFQRESRKAAAPLSGYLAELAKDAAKLTA